MVKRYRVIRIIRSQAFDNIFSNEGSTTKWKWGECIFLLRYSLDPSVKMYVFSF